MKTISDTVHSKLEIDKSKFITILQKINNTDEAMVCLNLAKKTYPKASHYCYAYILDDNNKRMSDDGEPSGTAGMPILNVLESNNLNYVMAIVVRYFGGILLGTGGLVRAYTKSVTDSLSKSTIDSLVAGYIVDIKYNYSNSSNIDYLLKNTIITNKSFSDTIEITFSIDYVNYKRIKHELSRLCYSTTIIKNIYIKK